MNKAEFKVVPADSQTLRDQLYEVRRKVFVEEQNVSAEEEFDEFEDISTHFVALDSASRGIGSSRWRRTDKGCKLERFAVVKEWRNKGVASALVQAILDDIAFKMGSGNYLYMHAQLDAIPLYEKFGFQKVGELFIECDIKHFKMEKTN